MCQLVLPGMREQGWGRIVNISSMGGRLTFPGGGIYHATKHAVEAICDAMRWEVADFGIDVVCVEPGLIVTGFGEAAESSIEEGTGDEGPYSEFNRRVGEATAGVYKGPMRRLGGGPEAVAKAIERAITARRPKTRYRVTPSAKLAIAQRRLVTDRMWDRAMAAQFKRPKP
jgi:NAD(P)-dependent dehydrogenase (short-subunit alcohol dehydrogenase family)